MIRVGNIESMVSLLAVKLHPCVIRNHCLKSEQAVSRSYAPIFHDEFRKPPKDSLLNDTSAARSRLKLAFKHEQDVCP